MSPFQVTPPEDHQWATIIASVAATLGVGGLAALLKVWVENRRLLKKDYRQALSERITELEAKVNELYGRITALSEENGRLEAENEFLKSDERRG